MRLDVQGLDRARETLGTFADDVGDLRGFWPRLAKHLADTAQERWPLRRRTGRLRKSLTWRGTRLGPRGIYEPAPDRMRFGSKLFYARFFQYGSKRTGTRELIHIEPERHVEQLGAWLRERASAAGLEVT